MRLIARQKLGFYPLPSDEAERIRCCLTFPEQPFCCLDPCVGDGMALAEITRDATAFRYGIELDAQRAAAARSRADEVVHGSCFDVQCPTEAFSLIYLNPPYDYELGEGRCERMEQLFLEHTYRWLMHGGLLLLVIPCKSLRNCGALLAQQFGDTQIHRLTSPESERYGQIVVMAVRLARWQKDRRTDSEISRARTHYEFLSRNPQAIPGLTADPDKLYAIPTGSGSVKMVNRGLPLDEIEDILPQSTAYRQAATILFAPASDASERPLTPLHGGHVGLLCTAGMLNGVFGTEETRHVACWQSIKLRDRSEEEEDGATVIREKERFSNELALAFSTGEIALLK